jgi:hypothetical protein
MSSITQNKCTHYWIIDIADGPLSKGECKLCHKIANFKNSVWVDSVGNAQGFDYWHKDIVGDKWKVES